MMYIIKAASEITQGQLNVIGTRDISRLRKSNNGLALIEATEEVAERYFLNDRWFSEDEIRNEMQKAEWSEPASEGFMAAVANLFSP